MIIDITKIELTPGNFGEKCKGNGMHFRNDGSKIESCCDGCVYFSCCINKIPSNECKNCEDTKCPRSGKRKNYHNIIDRFIRIFIAK